MFNSLGDVLALINEVKTALKDNNVSKEEAQKIALALVEVLY